MENKVLKVNEPKFTEFYGVAVEKLSEGYTQYEKGGQKHYVNTGKEIAGEFSAIVDKVLKEAPTGERFRFELNVLVMPSPAETVMKVVESNNHNAEVSLNLLNENTMLKNKVDVLNDMVKQNNEDAKAAQAKIAELEKQLAKQNKPAAKKAAPKKVAPKKVVKKRK